MKKYFFTILAIFAILTSMSLAEATLVEFEDSLDEQESMEANRIYSSFSDENWIELFNPENGGICFTASDLRLLCVTPDIIQFYDSIGVDSASAYWAGNREGITIQQKLMGADGKPCLNEIKGGIIVGTTCPAILP